MFEIVDGRRTDDGRTTDHGYTISSPCEPEGSGELKNEYPCKPQFYYTKVGCKGVFITRTCFHDVVSAQSDQNLRYALTR